MCFPVEACIIDECNIILLIYIIILSLILTIFIKVSWPNMTHLLALLDINILVKVDPSNAINPKIISENCRRFFIESVH